MKLTNWTAIYANYPGLWVALDLDNETVIGSGRSPEQALDEAHTKGFADAAITYVPKEILNFAGGPRLADADPDHIPKKRTKKHHIRQEVAPRRPEIDEAVAEGLADTRAGRVTPAFKNMAEYRAWRKTPEGEKFARTYSLERLETTVADLAVLIEEGFARINRRFDELIQHFDDLIAKIQRRSME